MNSQRISLFASFLSIFFLNISFATTPLPWVKAENMLSPSDGITATGIYHDRLYIAGYDSNNFQPNNCTFVYSYQSFNNWLSVANGMQTPPNNCMRDIHSFVVFNDQLYAGGLSGFYVYNGNDYAPNWTSLSMAGLPTVVPTILSFAVLENKLYAVATAGDGTGPGVYVYNSQTQTWTNISSMVPVQPRVAGPPTSVIAFNNKLYWLYNFTDTPPSLAFHGTVYVYNGNDSAPGWSTVFASTDDRELVNMDIFNNTLIVSGNTNQSSMHPQAFILAYNGNDAMPQWNDISGYVSPFAQFSVTAMAHNDNDLYIGGGSLRTNRSAIYQFNGDFAHPNWIEADQGVSRYIGPAYNSVITNFAAMDRGFFAVDFVTQGSGISIASGSVVYIQNDQKKINLPMSH